MITAHGDIGRETGVSAYKDSTLKVLDLESGACLHFAPRDSSAVDKCGVSSEG